MRVRVDGETYDLSDVADAQPAAEPRHRGRRRPAGRARRRTARGSTIRSRPRSRPPTGSSRSSVRAEPGGARLGRLLRAVRLSGVRPLAARARAAAVLVQLALRRVPGLPRRRAPGARSTPISSWATRASRSSRASSSRGASRPGISARSSCPRWPRRSSSISTRRGASTARPRSTRCSTARPAGSSSRPTARGGARVRERLGRRAQERRAALQGVLQRRGARRARGVHDRAAVPDVRREAAQGREPRGAGPRARASATWWTCRSSGRSSSSRAFRFAAAERAAPRERHDPAVDAEIAGPILKEVRDRLRFLRDVGLDYLTLGRGATRSPAARPSASGSPPRSAPASSGVLYILDEPSIGLHQRDNERLLATLEQLRDLGNTVIVVEHDEETIEAADHVIDLGPRAGRYGGEVIAEGTRRGDPRRTRRRSPGGISAASSAFPSRRGRREAEPQASDPGRRRAGEQPAEPDVDIPLGLFIAVTGVSGSGQVHPGDGHPVSGAGAALLSRQGRARRAHADRGASSTSTR